MNQKSTEAIHRINYLTSELDALYHTMSQKLGISDSVSRILYTIYDSGNSCPLCDVCKKTGISKQTVNSAIRSLEADGVLSSFPMKDAPKKSSSPTKGRNWSGTPSRGCLPRRSACSPGGARRKPTATCTSLKNS